MWPGVSGDRRPVPGSTPQERCSSSSPALLGRKLTVTKAIVEEAVEKLIQIGMVRKEAWMLLAFDALLQIQDLDDLQTLHDRAGEYIDVILEEEPELAN